MKKILYVATVRSHIGQFHINFLQLLKSRGFEIHGAYRDNSEDKPGLDLSVIDKTYEILFRRNPLRAENLKAYWQLKKVIASEDFCLIHCHTPVGGVVTRLAAVAARKKGTIVVYTAHGFHFFKGAAKKNWAIFYPVEKVLAKYTDAIITMNREDYERAKKFRCRHVYFVHGVGIDVDKFHCFDEKEKEKLRKKYGFDDELLLVYPADISVRKNQKMLIETAAQLRQMAPGLKFKILMPGQPILREQMEQFANEKGVSENCCFMGYRRDIQQLVGMSDIMVSSSKQEGLPVCIMEAMACGKPIICTKVRGNEDLVTPDVNGFLCDLDDVNDMAEKIYYLYQNPARMKQMGDASRQLIDKYSKDAVNEELWNIYTDLLGKDLNR